MEPKDRAPPGSCQALMSPRQTMVQGSQGAMSLVLHHASLQGLEALWVSSSPQEEQVVEGRAGGRCPITGPVPSTSPLAGLQGRLGIRYKAICGPLFTLPASLCCLHCCPWFILCPYRNISSRKRQGGLIGDVSFSGPVLAWLTHNACAGETSDFRRGIRD